MCKTVCHIQRLPQGGQVSIERLFDQLRKLGLCEYDVNICPNPSKGIIPRLKNLIWVRKLRGVVYHIVGDSHYLAFGLPKIRTVLTIHDCAALNRLNGIAYYLFRFLWFTGPMKRCAVVTTISSQIKDELRKHCGKIADRIIIIPNCVNSEFKFNPKAYIAKYPIVLQVGTGWNKNVERVARALVDTGCRLEIIGLLSDEQKRVLESLRLNWLELGRVSDDDLVKAYERCDMVVFASLYEGFGLPIIEAQAVGRPLITSDRSPMKGIAGTGAIFVDPESEEAIHNSVVKLMQDSELRMRLVAAGKDNVSRYNPETISRRYEEIYTSII